MKSLEARDRLLAGVAFEAIWERDLRNDALTWDGNLESIFGYHHDEVVNHMNWWREHVHPDDRESVEEVASRAIGGDAPGWSTEYRFCRKDGSWAWVASRCVIERDGSGQPLRAIGAMIDISRLKDAESRLRLFTEQIPARACVTDRELRVVWDAGTAFTDRPSVEGQTVPELFAQSPDRERVLEGCFRALAGDSSMLDIDDGTSAAQLRLEPFRDPAGNVMGVVGVAFDITDRMRSEKQVRAGQMLLQQVLETLPVGVNVLDRAGDILLSNSACRSIWGDVIVSGSERWSRSTGFRRGSAERIAANEWASHRALENGETIRDELIDIVTFDGEQKTIENFAAPIRDADGVITGAAVVNHDVTERVRAEEALRKTENLLVDAEKLGQTGSWQQELDSGDMFNSETNLHLFFGDDKSKGTRFEDYVDVIHPDDRARVIDSRERLHAGTGSGNIEFRVVWPDGSVHWIFGRATIVRDAAGRPLRAYGTNADITERKLAEEELGRRTRELQALSARLLQSQDEERRRIARELHDSTAQDLGALRINLSMLTRSAAAMSDPSARQAIEESVALADRAIAELRTLSYVLHPPMIEEAGLLPSLRWYAQGFQERSGIAVTLDLPAEIERLPIETETAVFRIVQEALTNIRRHSGSVVAAIRIEREPEILKVSIRDKGSGLPKALRGDEKLFAAGVGIASIRERARELGGSIDLQSDDSGTGIEVRLPIVES
jgi:PAS domain S-box-containing protein